jgi:endonuclease/exonuclease/phosphatase family metal-dependent hydrolase
MKTRSALFYALSFLFFFQLLIDFVGGIYAFGLLGTSIPPELAAVILLFSPILLLFFRRPGRRLLAILLLIILLARVIEPALDTRWRMLVSGAGVAAWLMFFPVTLWRAAREQEGASAGMLMWGLLLGVLLSVLLRVAGSGVDSSTFGWGQTLGIVLALAAGWLWFAGNRQAAEAESTRGEKAPGGFMRATLLSLGVMAALTLIYYAFAAPAVMARWTGLNDTAILATLMIAWAGFAAAIVWRPGLITLSKPWLLLWNGLFVAALYLAISGQQTIFPAAADAYPLMANYPAIWATAAFYLMLLLSPVIFLDFYRLTGDLIAVRPSMRKLGGSFAIASFFLLLAIFAHVFTTTYDYIPVVGPMFRDAFAMAYLFVGAVLFLGVAATLGRSKSASSAPKAFAWTAIGLTAIILAGHLLITAHPQPAADSDEVTILTYNIQQGYSDAGRKNYDGQLAQIRAINPDIIGLQESDTARIANSNDDVVRYFADHLNMYSYYGPKTVDGTFGIALLSRYPIQNAMTFYMYSEGEQVAAIRAQVMVEGAPLTVFVTHLGNGGPMIQQQQLLQIIDDTPRAVALGDFNFRPDSEQYALTTQTLLDSWTQKWPDWRDDQGQKPENMIDHIFISPDLQALDARYYPDGPSDHPALTATIRR